MATDLLGLGEKISKFWYFWRVISTKLLTVNQKPEDMLNNF